MPLIPNHYYKLPTNLENPLGDKRRNPNYGDIENRPTLAAGMVFIARSARDRFLQNRDAGLTDEQFAIAEPTMDDKEVIFLELASLGSYGIRREPHTGESYKATCNRAILWSKLESQLVETPENFEIWFDRNGYGDYSAKKFLYWLASECKVDTEKLKLWHDEYLRDTDKE